MDSEEKIALATLKKDWDKMSRDEKDALLKELTEQIHGPGSWTPNPNAPVTP